MLLISQAFCITKAIYINLQGCTYNIQHSECFYNVECINEYNIYPSYEYYEVARRCNNSIYSNGQMYLPINIVLRINNHNEIEKIIWNTNDGSIFTAIFRLDFSYNNFHSLPFVQPMEKLNFLNMSHNSLTVAKLFDEIDFPNLVEIDFSFNMINNIEVDDDLHVFDKLKKLDLSRNAIDNIPEAVFERFGELECLNLSYNNLKTLDILSFEGLKSLRSLRLEYNDIPDINSSLLRFKYLKYLSLGHNRIDRILGKDFQNLSNLVKIDLSFNKISVIDKVTFQNMSLLGELNLSDNSLDSVDKEYFKYTNHIFSVNLKSNKLKYLPVELFKGKNMSFFSVQDNILQGELVSGTFFGLYSVLKLDLAYQYLTSIEENAFIGLDRLEILLLNNNKIRNISKKSFTSLQNIKHLDLSNNYIITVNFENKDLIKLRSLSLKNNCIMYIKHDDFNNLSSLKFLDLSYNNITRIDVDAFKALDLIVDFEISHNPLIPTLESITFDGITLVPKIDLSYSRVSLVKNNTFQNMRHLISINMSHSLLNELEFNSFTYICSIVIIDLSFNRLTSFIVNTTDLQNLNTLYLNNNLLSEISSVTLKNIPNLLKVSLSFNNLQTMHIDAFKDQRSLLELDLSFNPFFSFNFTNFTDFGNLRSLNFSGIKTNLSFYLFSGNQITKLDISYTQTKNVTSLRLDSFKNIEMLILSNNKISIIDKDAFLKIDHLRYLDLSYNNIKYIQPGAFKNNRHLYELNISHNFLTAISYGTFLGLIDLKILDLSFNYIENLDVQKFNEAKNLKSLIVDYNKIDDFNYFELSDTKLIELSLGDNPIDCQRIRQLKQTLKSVKITALREDVHSENVEGITCNRNLSPSKENQTTGENRDSEIIIKTLKRILLNSSMPNGSDKIYSESNGNELFANVTDVMQKSNIDIIKQLSSLYDATLSLNDNNNRTNSLLERLLKIVIVMNSAIRSTRLSQSENVTNDNITLYINKIRQNLEEDMLVQKESIMADLDNKISIALGRKNLAQNKVETYNAKNTNDSPEFIKICVVLTLMLAVALIAFKLYYCYKRRHIRSVRNTSLSRQQITESLENSNL